MMSFTWKCTVVRGYLVMPAEAHCCPEYVRRACDKIAWSDFERTKCGPQGERQDACSNAGIQRLKSLDSSQKHAGMTVSERLFEFKSIDNLTMSKPTWYASMRHVCDYYSGQQCAEAGIQRLKPLDYEIHPCISSCGPAVGCSNLLLADLVRPKTCWNDVYLGQL